MKAFIFPGQASQYIGMGADLYNEFDIARKYFDKADEVLGLDLKNTCFSGPEEKLVRTEFTQPAIFVHSTIMAELLKQAGFTPDVVAGHSLGEYSALVAVGALTFEDALKAVKLRSQLMQKCCDLYPGTMAASMGLSLNQVTEAIKDIDGVVPANFNSPDQVAISGRKDAVELACQKLKEAGAKRAILLAVGGAYHSPLMQEAKTGMAQFIDELKFGKFACPVIANVSAMPVSESVEMKRVMKEQITSPVLWYPTLEKMYEMGFREYYEIGPGKVLQGLLKRSLSGKEYLASGFDKVEDVSAKMGAHI